MINWKLRLKNKTTLISLLTVIATFIYQILGLFDIVPKVSESDVTSIITLLVNVLVAVGIVVDPTTSGIRDSERALTYEKPAEISSESEE